MSTRIVSTLLLVLAMFATGWLLGRQQRASSPAPSQVTVSQPVSNGLPPVHTRPSVRESAAATAGKQTIQEALDKALRNVGSRRSRGLRDCVLSLTAAEVPQALGLVERHAPATDKAILRGQLLTRWAETDPEAAMARG